MLSYFPLSLPSGWRDKLIGSVCGRRVRIVELIKFNYISWANPGGAVPGCGGPQLSCSEQRSELGLLQPSLSCVFCPHKWRLDVNVDSRWGNVSWYVKQACRGATLKACTSVYQFSVCSLVLELPQSLVKWKLIYSSLNKWKKRNGWLLFNCFISLTSGFFSHRDGIVEKNLGLEMSLAVRAGETHKQQVSKQEGKELVWPTERFDAWPSALTLHVNLARWLMENLIKTSVLLCGNYHLVIEWIGGLRLLIIIASAKIIGSFQKLNFCSYISYIEIPFLLRGAWTQVLHTWCPSMHCPQGHCLVNVSPPRNQELG